MKTKHVSMIALVLTALALTAGNARATTLFAWETFVPDESLYSVDTSAPPTGTLIGPAAGNIVGVISDIEYGGGVIYGADTGAGKNLYSINPSTGLYTSALTLTYPTEGDVLTALEFVGGTLYAGLTTEGGGGATFLSTVNLGTGVVTTVGATGVNSPMGGLAYDTSTNTMYAISSGGSSAELFTINLASGTATSVGLVTIGGTTLNATALEFGLDGILYSLPNRNSSIVGHLLTIDPSNGNATDLGDILSDGGTPVALTSVPEPAALVLGAFALVSLALAAQRRQLPL